MAKSKINPEFLKQISIMDKEYSSGKQSFFDNFDDNVVIYTNITAEPIKGKENYVKNFSELLGSKKRKLNIISRQIQSLGSIYIVYQVIQVVQEGVAVNMKQSIVWGVNDKGYKVNHMHTSTIGTPHVVSPLKKNIGSINVINEKIATIAATVGVAQ